MKQKTRTLASLAGPKGIPFLGNLLQIDLLKLHTIMEAWAAEYGEIFKFRLANRTIVAISNPAVIQSILKDRPSTYRRVSAIERVGSEFGSNGVFAAEGEQWQRQRLLTMQAFKPEQFRRFFPVMRTITERLLHRWQTEAAGKVKDIQDDWMRFTVDITTNFAFGYDINLLEQENDSFQRHLEKFLPVFNRRANAPFPYWHFVKLPSERDMEHSLATIKETINSVIYKARQKLEQGAGNAKEPANFLEALLLAQDESGNGLSDSEILGNVITILVAGEDTTAHTLAWLVYLISQHPKAQEKIQQEADAVLGESLIPQAITDVEKLAYIEAVAHETLRLKSVAPLFFMEPNEDVELNNVTIPKGTFLMLLNRYGVLQDENFSHALEFRPERWLDVNASGCVHNRNVSIPFGGGPRFCPGRNLALLEIKMAIATLCRSFSIKLVEGDQPVQEVFSFTMRPENLRVKLEAR